MRVSPQPKSATIEDFGLDECKFCRFVDHLLLFRDAKPLDKFSVPRALVIIIYTRPACGSAMLSSAVSVSLSLLHMKLPSPVSS